MYQNIINITPIPFATYNGHTGGSFVKFHIKCHPDTCKIVYDNFNQTLNNFSSTKQEIINEQQIIQIEDSSFDEKDYLIHQMDNFIVPRLQENPIHQEYISFLYDKFILNNKPYIVIQGDITNIHLRQLINSIQKQLNKRKPLSYQLCTNSKYKYIPFTDISNLSERQKFGLFINIPLEQSHIAYNRLLMWFIQDCIFEYCRLIELTDYNPHYVHRVLSCGWQIAWSFHSK